MSGERMDERKRTYGVFTEVTQALGGGGPRSITLYTARSETTGRGALSAYWSLTQAEADALGRRLLVEADRARRNDYDEEDAASLTEARDEPVAEGETNPKLGYLLENAVRLLLAEIERHTQPLDVVDAARMLRRELEHFVSERDSDEAREARLRCEPELVDDDVSQLLDALKGAWWLEAAAAYDRLSAGIGRRS